VWIEPEIDGTIVDRLAATAQLEQALLNLQPLAGPLPVLARVPRVHAGDLKEAQAQVERALAKGVKVKFDGETWIVTPEEFSPFIVQKTNDDPVVTGAAAVSVWIDESGLAEDLRPGPRHRLLRGPRYDRDPDQRRGAERR
jgi:hypothetical protein